MFCEVQELLHSFVSCMGYVVFESYMSPVVLCDMCEARYCFVLNLWYCSW